MTIRTEEIAKFRTHLLSLCQQTEGWMSTKYFALMISQRTERVRYALDTLVTLGVLEKKQLECLSNLKLRKMTCYRMCEKRND